MNTPIDIIDYRVVEISVKQNPDFDRNTTFKPDFNIATDFYINTETDPVARLVMTVKHKKKPSSNQPYKMTLLIEGLFSYQPDVEREELEQFLQLNATSILYGLARGTVSQTTAIMTNGKVLLPTVNFYNARQKKTSPKKYK